MKSAIQHYQEIHDSLKVSVKIDHNEVLKLVVKDLIKKRNSLSNNSVKSFDDVLLYYLGNGDFIKYVIDGEEVE